MKLVPLNNLKDIEATLVNALHNAEHLRTVAVVAIKQNGDFYLTHSLTTDLDLAFIQTGLQAYVLGKFDFEPGK